MMKKFLATLFFLGLSFGTLSTAWAEPDIQLAKKYFTLGSELFDRGDYKEALAQFNKSFQYSSRPELHYNMARCHELLGQHLEAKDFYERYLTSEPDNAEMIRSRVANLERLIAKKKQEDSQANKPKVPAKGAASMPDIKTRQGGAIPVAGWSLVGFGGAALVAGAVLGGLAMSKESELEQAFAEGQRTLAEIQDGEAQGEALQTGAIISLAVGGAAAAAGAILLILNSTSKPEARQAWIAPAPGRGGGMVAAGFTW